MDPSTVGGDVPSLDATVISTDGSFPLNGNAPQTANGSSSNGIAGNVMLPNVQAMSAGEISLGNSSKMNNQMMAQTRLHCMTGRSDCGE